MDLNGSNRIGSALERLGIDASVGPSLAEGMESEFVIICGGRSESVGFPARVFFALREAGMLNLDTDPTYEGNKPGPVLRPLGWENAAITFVDLAHPNEVPSSDAM